jgi:hypothetical protein
MNDQNYIEELFKNKLGELEHTPSKGVWERTARVVRRRQFLQFRPGRMNIYYVAGLIVAATIVAVVLTTNKSGLPDNLPQTIDTSDVQVDSLLQQEPAVQPVPIPKVESESTRTTAEIVSNNDPDGAREQIQKSDLTKTAESSQEAINFNREPVSTLVAYFTPSVSDGCAPLTIELINSSINAVSSEWKTTGKMVAENRQSASVTFETPGTYPVTLVVKSADGLERSHTEQIVVHPQPDASFEIEDGQILNYSTGAVGYEWKLIAAGRKRGISDQFQVEYDPSWKGGESLILIATNIFGCTDTMVRTIPHPAGPELRFPNVFRPNPGGATGGWYNPAESDNSVFHPHFEEVPNTYNMKIFNKNGELIFESEDIRRGWDGYYQNAPAARGVYIYHCTGNWKSGESFSYRGDVTLLQHHP